MLGIVCRLIQRRLGAYRDGELGPTARTRAAAHLRRCPACAAELAALDRLRAALTAELPEPPEPVWDTFWPQVRTRLGTPAPDERPVRRPWSLGLAHPRLAFASALAAAALVAVAVLAPWHRAPLPERPAVSNAPPAEPGAAVASAAVVVHSVETADPRSSVMVYSNPETHVTVVWVFGLERTDI